MTPLSWTLCFLLPVLQLLQFPEGKQKPPSDSHFAVLNIVIGKDNLRTLQDKLGPTKKCRTKAHDGVAIAGYAGSNEDIVFEFGEGGGGDVTAFFLSLHGPRKIGCPLSELSMPSSTLTTSGGVHLGMTEQEFVGIFGVPMIRTPAGQWKYDWTLEKKYTEKEKSEAANAGHPVTGSYLKGITIEAEFQKGRLSYFYISRLETT
jgi:hypothetical protein